VLALAEDFGDPAASSARVRVVHAGADAPAVAVDVGNDGSPEITDLARFADTGAAGVELPARSLAIGIWAGAPLERVTAFTTPALSAGGDLFVIATGLLSAQPRETEGFALLAVGPSGVIGTIKQDPVVYALHASPDAPAVDIFAGAAELADDLRPGALSGAIQVPPGTYTLDLFAHAAGATRPAGGPAASATTPALTAGNRYLAIATGFLGGQPGFELLALVDELESAGEGARLRVVHASPDTPAVDVGTMSGQVLVPVWSALAFRDATEAAGTRVPTGDLDVGIGLAGSQQAVLTFDDRDRGRHARLRGRRGLARSRERGPPRRQRRHLAVDRRGRRPPLELTPAPRHGCSRPRIGFVSSPTPWGPAAQRLCLRGRSGRLW
jgi:hypothetical protein